MLKKLMLGTALCALTLSGAMAQSSTPAPQSAPAATQAPAASQDATGAKDMSKDKSMPAAQTTGQGSSQTSAPSSGSDFVMSQKPDQWLASKFKGTDVLGQDNQKIGDVTDILFDKTGQIEAYVVSVGGFLGMGSKNVALAPRSFDVVPGSNGAAPKLKLSMSKDQLKQAQNFTPYEAPRATTGSGGARPGGLGGDTAPSSNRGPSNMGK